MLVKKYFEDKFIIPFTSFFFFCIIAPKLKEVALMRITLVFLIIFTVLMGVSPDAGAYGGDDSTACYNPPNRGWFCNWNTFYQFYDTWWAPAHDRHENMLIGGYYFRIVVYNCYSAYQTPWNQCVGGTPGSMRSTWSCAYNFYDPWFENCDTCPNKNNKILLCCHAGNVVVLSAHPYNRPVLPPADIQALNNWLQNMNNARYPSSTPPLDPPPNEENDVWYVISNEWLCDCP